MEWVEEEEEENKKSLNLQNRYLPLGTIEQRSF